MGTSSMGMTSPQKYDDTFVRFEVEEIGAGDQSFFPGDHIPDNG
jgi:hypothetical protein